MYRMSQDDEDNEDCYPRIRRRHPQDDAAHADCHRQQDDQAAQPLRPDLSGTLDHKDLAPTQINQITKRPLTDHAAVVAPDSLLTRCQHRPTTDNNHP